MTAPQIRYKTFKDLERNILTAKMNLRAAEAELTKLVKMAGPKDVKSLDYGKGLTSQQYTPVAKQLQEIALCKYKVEVYKGYVADLEAVRAEYIEEINKLRKNCTDLELEVFYRHHVKRQSLNEISQALKYNYDYIRQVNVKIIKKITHKKLTDIINTPVL